jgi:hypothetical protein
MDARKRQQDVTHARREKFPEPRGWALNWDCPLETDAVAGPTDKRSNGAWRKFPEPSGWAAKWDGAVLSETLRRENGND